MSTLTFPLNVGGLEKRLILLAFSKLPGWPEALFSRPRSVWLCPESMVYWKRETGQFLQAATPSWDCLNTQKMGRTRARLVKVEAPS